MRWILISEPMRGNFLIICLVILLVAGNVSASITSGFTDFWANAFKNAKTVLSGFYSSPIVQVLSGGAITIGVIIFLQSMGFDVIGIAFDFLFFLFDLIFSITRFVLASEGNLVSFVVIFILLWFLILFV